ncbi:MULTISPECIES: conjugal transfer protein TraJ [unclassified Desulfovibrio]|uniref:plasmid mobilization protein n=1 Tax=unclassified Desulfovibrio TaxID=2593640 RepID=UPI0013EB963A|nr:MULTISPECIES: conjugal transfer protein TraJ [unclassified Desulfovibrio]
MSSPEKRPKRTEQIKAYVTPREFTLIMESSERAGLSMSEFARRVCLGFRVESREDQQARRELLKVNADLGRLGGLLKQALTSGHKEQIYGLLHKIDQLQANLKAKIRAL